MSSKASSTDAPIAASDLSAYGIAFISLRDNIDLSTPSGRLMFQIIGAMAEFERALIQERVKAGLRNARAKGKRMGRPQVRIDSSRVLELRNQGLSWRAISGQLRLGLGTVYRAIHSHLGS
jgi:DNA invertase Pin-like site-specific DNA recombinase